MMEVFGNLFRSCLKSSISDFMLLLCLSMFMDENDVAIGNIEEVNVLLCVGHVHHADMEMFFYSMKYAQQYLY